MEETTAKEAKTGGLLEGTRGGVVFQDHDLDGVEFAEDPPVIIEVAVVAAVMTKVAVVAAVMTKAAQIRPSIQVHVINAALARRRDVITDVAHYLQDDDHDLPEDAHHPREGDQEDLLDVTIDDVLDHLEDGLDHP